MRFLILIVCRPGGPREILEDDIIRPHLWCPFMRYSHRRCERRAHRDVQRAPSYSTCAQRPRCCMYNEGKRRKVFKTASPYTSCIDRHDPSKCSSGNHQASYENIKEPWMQVREYRILKSLTPKVRCRQKSSRLYKNYGNGRRDFWSIRQREVRICVSSCSLCLRLMVC